mmetsp:Transcript_16528/g.23203  ORF Transcript_16528/g.23203 Transcript_16528/m.23203 type:complete len:268 (-) Transcript_16528:8-811(-)
MWSLQQEVIAANWSSLASVHLDPRLRNWVLLPIFIVMVLQGILRHYITMWLKDEKTVKIASVQQNELIRRSQRLRTNYQFITPSAFRMRKCYFIQKAFRAKTKSEKEEVPQMPQQDPLAMVGMMKQNVAMIVPQMLMMAWISYFFSGFVVAKFPFPLANQFKSISQRGILLKSLDPSYVSSLCWYFLIMFGLKGVMSLVLGANNEAIMTETQMMQQQMQMGGMGGPQQPDPSAMHNSEREELQILHHEFVVSDAEYRLLGQSPPLAN